MKTRFLLAVVIFLLAVTQRSGGWAAERDMHALVVGGGEVSGVFFPEAGAICRVVNKGRSDEAPRCLVEPSGGSQANIAALRNGTQQLAIVQSKVLAEAVGGTGSFAKEPFPGLRTLLSLHGEALVLVVGPDVKIKSAADLKGKRANLGRPGGYQRAMADRLLEAEGLKAGDLASALEMEPDAQIKALCDGKIDIAFFSGLQPTAEVQQAMDECGGRLLPLDDKNVEAYLKRNPFLVRLRIRADDYMGLNADVPTFGLRAVLVTTDQLPTDVAYEITKAVFDNLDALKGMHPQLADLNRAQMAKDALAAPLHDGAAKYLREVGLP